MLGIISTQQMEGIFLGVGPTRCYRLAEERKVSGPFASSVMLLLREAPITLRTPKVHLLVKQLPCLGHYRCTSQCSEGFHHLISRSPHSSFKPGVKFSSVAGKAHAFSFMQVSISASKYLALPKKSCVRECTRGRLRSLPATLP